MALVYSLNLRAAVWAAKKEVSPRDTSTSTATHAFRSVQRTLNAPSVTDSQVSRQSVIILIVIVTFLSLELVTPSTRAMTIDRIHLKIYCLIWAFFFFR